MLLTISGIMTVPVVGCTGIPTGFGLRQFPVSFILTKHCPQPVMVADFRTLRWAKQDLLKGGLDHSVLNEVLPERL